MIRQHLLPYNMLFILFALRNNLGCIGYGEATLGKCQVTFLSPEPEHMPSFYPIDHDCWFWKLDEFVLWWTEQCPAPAKQVHILISRTCGYVNSHSKRE